MVYGTQPILVPSYISGTSNIEAVDSTLTTMEEKLGFLKKNLLKAQAKMKRHADSDKRAFAFNTGYLVYLRLQPFHQQTVARRANKKLSLCYFGPFQITKKLNQYHMNYTPKFKNSSLISSIIGNTIPWSDSTFSTKYTIIACRYDAM